MEPHMPKGRTSAPLDPSIYTIAPEASTFFKSQTGIHDDEELKQHIITIQRRAYELHDYPCIWSFRFLSLKITRLEKVYRHLLKLGKEGGLFLDIGCCFGTDARKAAVDGFPVNQIILSDLLEDFYHLGHELFKTTPETFPATFIPGDIFDPSFVTSREPFDAPPGGPTPDLHSLKSLIPLQGRVSAIHASAFFHLFSEEQQLEVAKKLASLLAPSSGSMIFGSHIGMEEGARKIPGGMFCHSPESWSALWNGGVFKNDEVEIRAGFRPIPANEPILKNSRMQTVATGTGSLWWVVKRK